MRHTLTLLWAAAIVVSGCSKPTPEEYYAQAEREEGEAILIADTITVLEERKEVFADAIETYTELIDQYPSSTYAETALYKLATIYNNHTREFRMSVATFDRYLQLYPNGENAAVSRFMMGYIYNNELGMLDSAKAAYERFLSDHPDHEMAPSAHFELENLGRSPEELVPAESGGEAQVARGGDDD